jgi:hypothetical protein
MPPVDDSELPQRAGAWVRETRDQAQAEFPRLREDAATAADELASGLARRGEARSAPDLDTIQQVAAGYLASIGSALERTSEALATGLEQRLSPLDARDDIALASARIAWDRNARAYGAMVGQYVAGWVEGGGVALVVMNGLQPGEGKDATAYRALLRTHLAFVAERYEAAMATWLDEVQSGLEELLGAVVETVQARPPDPRQARLAELLALADQLKVRIRNVPDSPSDRYLDKLETQLDGIAKKRDQTNAASEARLARFHDLMAFANQLKVRVKGAPSAPSDAWLDKMEAKLTEVALRKGIAIPQGIEPPTESETRRTNDLAPERATAPPPDAQTMSLRLRDLLERAGKAGLDLGTMPESPTDAWLDDMEARLDAALAERKAKRKAERQRRDAERRDRIETLKRQSVELGLDLGEFPPFPTDDWLARAELRIASVMLRAEQGEAEAEQAGARVQRLREVQAAAAAHGVDLGEVPPDADEVWLTWAESRVADAEAGDGAIAVEAESGEEPPRAYLVFEEGTVQEKVWPIGDDGLSIGRSRGNIVQIRDDAGVSRRHAELAVRSGEYYIKDLGSTKGTLVDDEVIRAEERLLGGERIQIGDTRFVFRVR